MERSLSPVSQQRRWALAVGLAAAVFFAYFYVSHPNRPGATSNLGWIGWYDQGRYLVEANSMANLNLDPSQYSYPLGYPFLAVPFLPLMPLHPFFFPNLIAYALSAVLFYLLVLKWLGQSPAVLGTALLIFATPLTELTVVPWTSTPVLLAYALVFYVGLARREIGYPLAIAAGALLALSYASRGGGELLFVAPFGLAMLWEFRKETHFLRKVALGGLVFAVGVGLNLVATHLVFDTVVHPYYERVLELGFDFSKIPQAIWGAFFYSGTPGAWWQPLLLSAPWLALMPLGFWALWRTGQKRSLHMGLLIGFVASLLVTAAKNPFGADCLQYRCLHYLKPWFPIAGFYALASVTLSGAGLKLRKDRIEQELGEP